MGNNLIKNIFFVAAFFLLFSNASFSQRFKAGILAGLTASQISGDQLAGFDRPGFEFGGLVSLPISQKFDWSFQIVFIQKGSKGTASIDQATYTTYRLRLNYIEVPVLVRYNFSKRLQFEGGPTFGKLISSKEEDAFGEIPAPKEFKSFEFGGMLGMSYMLFNNFYLNLEGSNSFLPVRDAGIEGGFKVGRDQFNSVLMFTFKYIFNKKTEEQQ